MKMKELLEIRSDNKAYTLYKVADSNFMYWLENEQHDAVSMSEDKLFKMLDKHFRSEESAYAR